MAKKQRSKKAGSAREATKGTTPTAKAPRTKERDPRLPAAGTTLTRTFKGKDYRVTVLDAGFRYDGREFRSLTAIAREVTGYPACSGPAWFGIAERAAPTPKPESTRETDAPAATAKKRAPKRAAKVGRAGRDPQADAPKGASTETAPAAETPAA